MLAHLPALAKLHKILKEPTAHCWSGICLKEEDQTSRWECQYAEGNEFAI